MTSRRFGFGLGVALSFASFYSYSAPALAQDPAPPEPTPTPSPDAATAKPADTSTGTSAAEPAKEPEKAPEQVTPAEPPASATPTTASGTSVEREKAVSLLGVELLPGSAYPAAYTRGIKYGSLWLTMHGQQWPYMPMIGDKPGLRIGFSGSLWNDVSYAKISADPSLAGANVNDQNRWVTQTRGVA